MVQKINEKEIRFTNMIENKESIKFAIHLKKIVPKFILKSVSLNQEIVLYTSCEQLVNLMYFLKNHSGTRYQQLIDVCGVDYPDRSNRFEVVYQLLSLDYRHRIRVKIQVDEATAVPSIVHLFPSAEWFERETWDMYGIFFSNHPDLRRILTDYGFEGYPMRKDFPVSGYMEVRYDEEEKRVVNEPVELTQEFRQFNFDSPWEQSK
jgi:NADH/F420H2 dehydrogenase subunit C